MCTQVAWYIFFLVSPLSSNKAIRWFPSFLVASASFSCNSQFKFTNNKLLALKLQLMKLNCQIMLFMYQTSIALISGYHCRPSNVFIYVLIFISSDQKDERAKIGHLLREWRSFSPPPHIKVSHTIHLLFPFSCSSTSLFLSPVRKWRRADMHSCYRKAPSLEWQWRSIYSRDSDHEPQKGGGNLNTNNVSRNASVCRRINTGMRRRITTFRSTTDRMYDGGPIIL